VAGDTDAHLPARSAHGPHTRRPPRPHTRDRYGALRTPQERERPGPNPVLRWRETHHPGGRL